MSATILTWNLERKKVNSPYGKMAIDHLFEQSPDVMSMAYNQLGWVIRLYINRHENILTT